MKSVGKIVGWVLMLLGVVAIGVVIYLIVGDRIPGNFLTGLLLSAPALLAILIGSGLVRAANRRQSTTFNGPDPQWTRNRVR